MRNTLKTFMFIGAVIQGSSVFAAEHVNVQAGGHLADKSVEFKTDQPVPFEKPQKYPYDVTEQKSEGKCKISGQAYWCQKIKRMYDFVAEVKEKSSGESCTFTGSFENGKPTLIPNPNPCPFVKSIDLATN